MLREIVSNEDHDRQRTYLVRVYKWFFNKMSAIGAITVSQKQEEDEFMNPDKYEKFEQDKQDIILRKKAKLQDESYNNQVQKGWFEAGERTIHKDIIPAKERIVGYKRRLPNVQNQSVGDITSTRPTTKSSTTRAMTAKTRVMTAKTRSETMYGQSFRPSFGTFYTSGEEVKYSNLLRVDSKSNYAHYIPTDDAVEQKLEKMWRESKNREIAEKRCNDELKHTLKEWGDAKARYEEDIQRKTENMWFGSNFVARAFIRKTKSKKIDYNRNHLIDSDGSSLLSDSELDDSEFKEIKESKEEVEGEDQSEEDQSSSNQNEESNRNRDLKHEVRKRQKTKRVQTAGRAR
jgi:hypothetical protein